MRTRILYLAATLSLGLASCTATRPAPADNLPAVAVDVAQVQRLDSLTLLGWLPTDLTALGLPPYLIPAPAGSSPRQRRQWQRAQAQNLARAGVLPAKVKNSNLATAPGAVAINRPSAPVATGASTATDARKAGTRGGSAAVGPGAIATATSSGPPWWVYVLVAVLGAVGWEVVTHYLTAGRWLPWRATAT